MKAWRVVWSGIPENEVYVAADTRAQAKCFVRLQIKDAGWEPKFVELHVIRAAKIDHLALDHQKVRGLGWRDNTTGQTSGCCDPAIKPEAEDDR